MRISLAGIGANPDAIGALVAVKTAAGVEARCVSPTRSYQSQSELPVTIGLGTANGPVDVRVAWPDGTTSTHPGIEVDRAVKLSHPRSAETAHR